MNARRRAQDHLEITQRLQWQGPEEWGVGTYRRVLADEIRIIDVRPGDVANIIDVRSQVRPTDWDLRIGPLPSRLLHHTRCGPPPCGR